MIFLSRTHPVEFPLSINVNFHIQNLKMVRYVMNVGPLHGMLRYATLVPSFQILKKKIAVYMSSRHYHNKWGLLMTKSCNDTRHTVEETSEKKSNTMETRVLNIYQEENKYVCRKERGIVLTADPGASSFTHPMDSKKIPCISRSALRIEARRISDERTLWVVRQLEAGSKRESSRPRESLHSFLHCGRFLVHSSF